MGALIGFAPWIVFWVVSGFETFEVGAVAALVSSLLVILPDILHRKVKVLDAGTSVAFAVLAVMGLTTAGPWFERYASPLSNGALTLVMLASLVIRQPFVLQYAREGRPPETWNEPHFVRACYVITWVWLASMSVQTALSLVAIYLPAERVVLRYVLPYVAMFGAIMFTRWYPHHLEAQARRRGIMPAKPPAG